MNKYQQKHIITLGSRKRQRLQNITRKGKHNVHVIKRAQILLQSASGTKDADIAQLVGVTTRTVENVRKRFVTDGIERALYDAPRTGQPPKLDEGAEAHLVAIACSDPPQGSDRWTLELLRERMIKDKKVKTISTVALWKRLNNRGIKPWREKNVVCSDH
jgi:transposase